MRHENNAGGPLTIWGVAVSQNTFAFGATLLAAVYYAALISGGDFDLLRPVGAGLTFNSMLDHMLGGDFFVDPKIIGSEGFVGGGATYAYFGEFVSLIRLPLVPLRALMSTDITALSCVVGAAIATFWELRSVGVIYSRAVPTTVKAQIFWGVVLVIMFGGPQLTFLRPSIYQEVVSWANAMNAAFVYCAIRGLIGNTGFSTPRLVAMATLAGTALLTRVSTGLGLYAATGLLVLSQSWPHRTTGRERKENFFQRLQMRRLTVVACILLTFAAACGFVNYSRSGNPFVFADFHRLIALNSSQHPRIIRFDRYGEFNPARFWYGLLYYFLPVWTLIHNHHFLQGFQERLIDAVELPPSSFFLTDPLLIFLTCIFFRRCKDLSGVVDLRGGGFLLCGLALPGLLMTMAVYMAFRYRMEFYPPILLAALLGYFEICRRPLPRGSTSNFTRLIWILTGLGVFSSHVVLLLYRISPFGPSTGVLYAGWLKFYYWQLINLSRGHL